jgi:hypothetical protein
MAFVPSLHAKGSKLTITLPKIQKYLKKKGEELEFPNPKVSL